MSFNDLGMTELLLISINKKFPPIFILAHFQIRNISLYCDMGVKCLNWGRFKSSLTSPNHNAAVELITMPLIQGATCLFDKDYEVSYTSNTDFLKKVFFSEIAKMGCFMEMSSCINRGAEFRRPSLNTTKI